LANRPASTRFSAPFLIRFPPAAIFRRGTVDYRTNTGQYIGRIEVTTIDVKRNRVISRRDLIPPLIREIDRPANISILLHPDNGFTSV